MTDFLEELKRRAREAKPVRIVFPEPEDRRVLTACRILKDERLAEPLLVGDPKRVKMVASQEGIDLSDLPLFHPADDLQNRPSLSKELYRIRQHRGVTLLEAQRLILDPIYYGTMLLYTGEADGIVAGAIHPTSWTFRPLLQILPKEPSVSYVSSCFVISLPNSLYGHNGLIIFADCGLIPNPDAQQLAEIAICSAETARSLFLIEPRVALLSFSTKGSTYDPLTAKVVEATRIANQKRPDLLIDGELQADAALVPEVAAKKNATGPVAGRANVLIFPDLNAGNIGYKLVQRLANAEAWGPLVQGLNRAASDLSRGCSIRDIVAVSTVVAIQARALEKKKRCWS